LFIVLIIAEFPGTIGRLRQGRGGLRGGGWGESGLRLARGPS